VVLSALRALVTIPAGLMRTDQLIRIYAAAFVAPWAAPVAVLLLRAAQGPASPYQSDVPWILGFGVVTSYIGTLVLGLPLVVVLHRIHRLTLVPLLLCGSATGAVVFYLFLKVFALMLGSPLATVRIRDLVGGTMLGVLVALVFGLIAGIPWRTPRPEHSSQDGRSATGV